MLERWLHREKIPAIHKRDLETILRELGMLEQIVAGSICCAKCGIPLSLDNIQCLYMEGDEVRLCCTNIYCYRSITLK